MRWFARAWAIAFGQGQIEFSILSSQFLITDGHAWVPERNGGGHSELLGYQKMIRIRSGNSWLISGGKVMMQGNVGFVGGEMRGEFSILNS